MFCEFRFFRNFNWFVDSESMNMNNMKAPKHHFHFVSGWDRVFHLFLRSLHLKSSWRLQYNYELTPHCRSGVGEPTLTTSVSASRKERGRCWRFLSRWRKQEVDRCAELSLSSHPARWAASRTRVCWERPKAGRRSEWVWFIGRNNCQLPSPAAISTHARVGRGGGVKLDDGSPGSVPLRALVKTGSWPFNVLKNMLWVVYSHSNIATLYCIQYMSF